MKYHILHSASYLILVKDAKILLSRRYNTGWMDGNYSLPAGHVEQKESPVKTMIRETKEEINIHIKSKDLKLVHVMHRIADYDYIDFFFLAKNYSGEIKNNEPNKCNDLSWFSLNKLPNNLLEYIKQALDCQKKKIFYSEYVHKN